MNPSCHARAGLLRPNMQVAIRHPHGPLTISRVVLATWQEGHSPIFPPMHFSTPMNTLSYLAQGLEEDHWQRLQLEKVLQCNLAFMAGNQANPRWKPSGLFNSLSCYALIFFKLRQFEGLYWLQSHHPRDGKGLGKQACSRAPKPQHASSTRTTSRG